MTSVRGKKSRSAPRSGSNRAKAKAKKRRSTTMALVSPTKHVKTQSRKPHRGQRAQPRNEQMPTGGGAGGRANSAPTRKRKGAATPLTAAMDRKTDLRSARSDPARIMVFWSPMAIVLRNQRMLSSIMLNVIQAQQHWARALQRLGTGIDISDLGFDLTRPPAHIIQRRRRKLRSVSTAAT